MFLDTSVLIEAVTSREGSAVRNRLRGLIASGERMAVPALAHYEFLRGPRVPAELALQEAWFPLSEAVVFRPDEARVSAKLYRSVSRARGREVDLAIAACAIVNNAFVWTLNSKDFADIPNLRLLP